MCVGRTAATAGLTPRLQRGLQRTLDAQQLFLVVLKTRPVGLDRLQCGCSEVAVDLACAAGAAAAKATEAGDERTDSASLAGSFEACLALANQCSLQ